MDPSRNSLAMTKSEDFAMTPAIGPTPRQYYPSLRGTISSATVCSPLRTVVSNLEAAGWSPCPPESLNRTMDASVIGHGLCFHFGSGCQAGEA
jgi:hypothetical protein